VRFGALVQQALVEQGNPKTQASLFLFLLLCSVGGALNLLE
jgi:hypothetical protein